MLAMQKNLLEKSAAELLRTDSLHMSTKEFNTHKDYPPGSFVLVHYRTGAPPSRLHTYWRGPMMELSIPRSVFTLTAYLAKGFWKFLVSKSLTSLFCMSHVHAHSSNLECRPALLSTFFPTFLHFTKF